MAEVGRTSETGLARADHRGQRGGLLDPTRKGMDDGDRGHGWSGGFEIGLVMAGAVSASAFAAGVVDFLIQALDQWHEGKRGNDPRCPAMTSHSRRRRAPRPAVCRWPAPRPRLPMPLARGHLPEVASQCRLPLEDRYLRHAFCDRKSLRDN